MKTADSLLREPYFLPKKCHSLGLLLVRERQHSGEEAHPRAVEQFAEKLVLRISGAKALELKKRRALSQREDAVSPEIGVFQESRKRSAHFAALTAQLKAAPYQSKVKSGFLRSVRSDAMMRSLAEHPLSTLE